GAIAIGDRFLDAALHFLGLAPEHGGLVRHSYRAQMNIRIKTGRVGAFEFLQKRRFVAAAADVIADVIGVGQREDDKVMPLAVAEGARAGRLGFFVLGLAVNDRGGGFAGVFAHSFPDAHDVAAGRVHDLAAAILDLLQNRKLGPEGGQNDNVIGLELRDIGLFVVAREILDA